jgi:ABC-type nitrate/sulfonate/bicarbonate transport system permease component
VNSSGRSDSLPQTIVGLRNGVSLALVTVVVAEMLMTSVAVVSTAAATTKAILIMGSPPWIEEV